jgi:hypothetical protein
MNIPGFTAEASFYRTSIGYRLGGLRRVADNRVQPADWVDCYSGCHSTCSADCSDLIGAGRGACLRACASECRETCGPPPPPQPPVCSLECQHTGLGPQVCRWVCR